MTKYETIAATEKEKTTQESRSLKDQGLMEFMRSEDYRFGAFCSNAMKLLKPNENSLDERLFSLREKFSFKSTLNKTTKKKVIDN